MRNRDRSSPPSPVFERPPVSAHRERRASRAPPARSTRARRRRSRTDGGSRPAGSTSSQRDRLARRSAARSRSRIAAARAVLHQRGEAARSARGSSGARATPWRACATLRSSAARARGRSSEAFEPGVRPSRGAPARRRGWFAWCSPPRRNFTSPGFASAGRRRRRTPPRAARARRRRSPRTSEPPIGETRPGKHRSRTSGPTPSGIEQRGRRGRSRGTEIPSSARAFSTPCSSAVRYRATASPAVATSRGGLGEQASRSRARGAGRSRRRRSPAGRPVWWRLQASSATATIEARVREPGVGRARRATAPDREQRRRSATSIGSDAARSDHKDRRGAARCHAPRAAKRRERHGCGARRGRSEPATVASQPRDPRARVGQQERAELDGSGPRAGPSRQERRPRAQDACGATSPSASRRWSIAGFVDLREPLAEERVDRTPVRAERRDRRVVAHRERRLDARRGHRLQDQSVSSSRV